jgi:hypothetical protein
VLLLEKNGSLWIESGVTADALDFLHVMENGKKNMRKASEMSSSDTITREERTCIFFCDQLLLENAKKFGSSGCEAGGSLFQVFRMLFGANVKGCLFASE